MEKATSEDVSIIVMGSTYKNFAEYAPILIKDFSRQIVVDSPAFNKASRKDILENLIKKENIQLAYRTKQEKEEYIKKLVKLTEYCSYSNIKTIIDKASQITVERGKKKTGMGEFIEAYLQLLTGRTSLPEIPDFNKEIITAHECGHATNLEVMNNIYKNKGKLWFPHKDVTFITLDPRGDFLGAVFEHYTDNQTYPFEGMFANIVCSYGGHSCEKEFFDMFSSSGPRSDFRQATAAAKVGIEEYGMGHNTGKISNAADIESAKYNENVYKDLEVILTNAQIVSDLITEHYRDFIVDFTNKYSKLIGTDNCLIDGDEFRKSLKNWVASRPQAIKEDLAVLEDIIMDIIKSSKQGKIYGKVKTVIK
jgi:ATP-dependent Zn protease